MTLRAAIADALGEGGPGPLEERLFGTTTIVDVERVVVDTAAALLGAAVTDGFFYRSSVSAVAGLELEDRRRVLVRFSRPEMVDDRLPAVFALQHRLSAQGFPCPRPILGPVERDGAIVSAETWLDPGPADDPRSDAACRALADGLVDLAQLAGPPDDHPGLAPSDVTDLYPPPHDLRFDFEATAGGSEWIDEVAERARAVLDATDLPRVVGHADWRGGNVVTWNGRVTAAYDWDSATAAPEPQVVGGNAHAWNVAWEWGPTSLPTVEESDRFVATYEHARGRPFTDEERHVLDAAHAYSLAYTSRCQHSDDQLGVITWNHDRAVDRLRIVAERL